MAVSTAEDGTVRMRGIMVDITGKKQAEEALCQSEEQLRQAQKMEAIGRLAGGIAHDFNNLITTISGYGDILPADWAPDHPFIEEVRQVTKAGARASELTSQLLTFSRQQVLKPEIVDLNVVVADMDVMLRRVIGEDIELVTTLGKNLGAVKADPGQLQQVILNLAVNARDAMPDGGMLTLQTTHSHRGRRRRPRRAPRRPRGRLGDARHHRLRDRDGRADQGPPVRAVLHDQGRRKGNRSGSVDGLRNRHTERWAPARREPTGCGNDLRHLPSPGVPSRGEARPFGRSTAGPTCCGGPRPILLVEDDDRRARASRASILEMNVATRCSRRPTASGRPDDLPEARSGRVPAHRRPTS